MSTSGSEHANEGGAPGASTSEPTRGPEDEPVEGAGDIEIPLGVPVSAEELSRLKREAQRKEGTTQEPGADPADRDVDSDDEG
jgi:hypothetical protein